MKIYSLEMPSLIIIDLRLNHFIFVSLEIHICLLINSYLSAYQFIFVSGSPHHQPFLPQHQERPQWSWSRTRSWAKEKWLTSIFSSPRGWKQKWNFLLFQTYPSQTSSSPSMWMFDTCRGASVLDSAMMILVQFMVWRQFWWLHFDSVVHHARVELELGHLLCGGCLQRCLGEKRFWASCQKCSL